jgi:fructokinase
MLSSLPVHATRCWRESAVTLEDGRVIVVCGEALIDLVPAGTGAAYEARPGGGPLNIAVGLGRLGVDVALLARLARDRLGRMLREHVRASRVALDLIIPSTAPTTLAVLGLDAAGVAAYDFYIDGCADGGWRVDELPEELSPGAALQVSGSLALPVPAMGDAVEALLARERPRRIIAFDPNIRPSLIRDEAAVRARLERWLGLADIVKASAEDLAWIAAGRPIASVVEQWRGMGPTVVVITRGADGAYAGGPAGAVDLPGEQVTVVDTVGAGDAFMSGLLASLDGQGRLARPALTGLTGEELAAAVGYAQRVAAITCGRRGADPPWRDEVD